MGPGHLARRRSDLSPGSWITAFSRRQRARKKTGAVSREALFLGVFWKEKKEKRVREKELALLS